jgi:hypothetical protein
MVARVRVDLVHGHIQIFQYLFAAALELMKVRVNGLPWILGSPGSAGGNVRAPGGKGSMLASQVIFAGDGAAFAKVSQIDGDFLSFVGTHSGRPSGLCGEVTFWWSPRSTPPP